MVNPDGYNGHDNGVPPENLSDLLQDFAIDNILLARRCEILAEKYDYRIKLSTLKNLNKHFKIASARRPPPAHIARSLIAKQMAENPTGTNGPNTIQKRVALLDGVPLARGFVRDAMCTLDPAGPSRRFPVKRSRKPRTALTDVAVFLRNTS
ncbi:hypothetical protein MIND_01393600 [Mycena indigotica]|uniref:Uncharacterized protein n=1 Tax=Mycena indigotica TaxID=2126181 RepID=A0A8H6RZW0_9AGAR|nr:uncharacterized protein MIND_01393600 [Mycena indigotica]KAF7289317.1 hypothetical protein MIND_01393600 [Mycena indigotica]